MSGIMVGSVGVRVRFCTEVTLMVLAVPPTRRLVAVRVGLAPTLVSRTMDELETARVVKLRAVVLLPMLKVPLVNVTVLKAVWLVAVDKSNVASLTETSGLVNVPAAPKANVPALTVVLPVYVLTPFKVSFPLPL